MIVGGSLVGLSTAIALARGGANVTVLERTPPGGYEGGGGLGVDVELLARVTGIATEPPVYWGADRATTAWPLLAAWLEREARVVPGVDVVRDADVIEVDDGEVRTRDGRSWIAAIVIGADGARSTVRQWVAPEAPDAVYAGYLLWRAMVAEDQLPPEVIPDADEPSREHYSGQYRLVTYPVPGADGSTVRGRRRLNLVWYDPARADLLTSSGRLDGSTVNGSLTADEIPASLREELRLVAAQRWPTPWREALDLALAQSLVFATPVAEYWPPRLVRGRVALVGDAAHAATPMVGGGFRQGLYDAAALATALLTERDYEVALSHYESQRLSGAQQHVARSVAASHGYLELRGR